VTVFVTVVVVLCHLLFSVCVEEIVTDSVMTPEMTFQQCVIGAQGLLALWISEHPAYRTGWRIDRYKCVPGHYEIKRRA
jgi:hypothetical protein